MADEHPPTTDPGDPAVYQIRVWGQLGADWGEWFDGMAVTPTADGATLISGLVADQAALHGLLRKVRDLGLPLLALCRGAPAAGPPDPAGQEPTP